MCPMQSLKIIHDVCRVNVLSNISSFMKGVGCLLYAEFDMAAVTAEKHALRISVVKLVQHLLEHAKVCALIVASTASSVAN